MCAKRAIRSLQAVAVGDAMGKMTEGYWPVEITDTYGEKIKEFKDPIQPKSSFSWEYAEITDDTRFTILIANSIIEKKCVDRDNIIARILKNKIKGWPGWENFCEAAVAGDDEIRRFSMWREGNGAAMRVSPIGIINSPYNISKIINDVEAGCSMTHGARSALSGACAIAAAVSSAVEGLSKKRVFEKAVEVARRGDTIGYGDDSRPVAERILLGIEFVDDYNGSDLPFDLRRVLSPGFKAYEGVPYALSLVYGLDNAKNVILGAVNQGGDADSIASMAGSIAAALYPNTLPLNWIEEVEEKNNIRLEEIAKNLLKIRARASDVLSHRSK